MNKILPLVFFLLLIGHIDLHAQIDSSRFDKIGVKSMSVVPTQLSKDNLWNNYQMWITKHPQGYRLSVISEDKESGVVYFRAIKKLSLDNTLFTSIKLGALDMNCIITFKLDFKDNKYRYIINDIAIAPKSLDVNYDIISINSLKIIIQELKAVRDITLRYFNGANEWIVDDNYFNLIDKYNRDIEYLEADKLNATSKKEVSNIDKQLTVLNLENNFLKDPLSSCSEFFNKFIDDLMENMNISSEF